MNLIKTMVFLLSLLPLARLVWLGDHEGLGANPIEFITRSTGTWALVFLCITLAMTPLRLITGLTIWIKLRRMLGLFCFFGMCRDSVEAEVSEENRRCSDHDSR